MRRSLVCLLGLLLLLLPVAAAAQNPCTAPLQTFMLVTDPSRGVVATLVDYNSVFNTAPIWTDSELKVVPKGAGNQAPPITNGTISNPKSAWVLVPGTTDCYQIGTVGQFLFGVPVNTDLELWVRLKTATTFGPWSANSVPFGRPGPPAAPGGIHITQRLTCYLWIRVSPNSATCSAFLSRVGG
jgi:hypothetical protein